LRRSYSIQPIIPRPSNISSLFLDGQGVRDAITLAVGNDRVSARELQKTLPRATVLHAKASSVQLVKLHEIQRAVCSVLDSLELCRRVAVLASRLCMVLVVHAKDAY
jgi:hypothetical protein